MRVSQNDNLTLDQIEKLGNTALFFAHNIYELNKTKLLKLVYLCEEYFVKKYAAPFLGLPFQAWQFGPVQKELFVNLDPESILELNQKQSILSDYITVTLEGNNRYHIKPLKEFQDDNFSDDEISIMEHIAQTYKYHDANNLISITHKGTSLWYNTVIKEIGLMDRFEKKIQAVSDIKLDFADLLEGEPAKNYYYSQLEMLEFSNSLK